MFVGAQTTHTHTLRPSKTDPENECGRFCRAHGPLTERQKKGTTVVEGKLLSGRVPDDRPKQRMPDWAVVIAAVDCLLAATPMPCTKGGARGAHDHGGITTTTTTVVVATYTSP